MLAAHIPDANNPDFCLFFGRAQDYLSPLPLMRIRRKRFATFASTSAARS